MFLAALWHETHTLAASTTSVTSLGIATGDLILGVQFNVNTAVTNGGDDTWTAALSGGDTTNVTPLGAAAAALNTKINTPITPVRVTATTEVTFTPNGGSFTAGVIEVIVYVMQLANMADV